uniref:Toxin SymE-like domain-containing protein n=2 Tax=Arsenophonus nasoniae TaxID=638 RepID=D2TZ10_9GAMM|nr:conserved hypothetical protein [Arsenophonus nasoniae]
MITGCSLSSLLTTQLTEIVTMAKCNCKVKPLTVTEATVKSRRYTVGYLPNRRKPNPSPQMIISGKWLSELGFHIGSHFTINRQAGELVIRLVKNH